MGIFHVPIEIGDPLGRRYERIDALADTGATYAVVPGSRLRAMGVQPHGRSPFELAGGSLKDFDIGQTLVRVNGQAVTKLVVFGDESMEPLLGA